MGKKQAKANDPAVTMSKPVDQTTADAAPVGVRIDGVIYGLGGQPPMGRVSVHYTGNGQRGI